MKTFIPKLKRALLNLRSINQPAFFDIIIIFWISIENKLEKYFFFRIHNNIINMCILKKLTR